MDCLWHKIFYSAVTMPPVLTNLRQFLRKEFRRRGAAYLILLISMVLAGTVFFRVKHNVEVREAARFEDASRPGEQAVTERMDRYMPYLALLGVLVINAAMFAVAWVQAKGREVAEQLREDLRQSQERLSLVEDKQRALRLFESLVNHTPAVAVHSFDREGRVQLWNAASEALYGFSEAEMKGRPLQDLILPPGEVAAFEKELQAVWESQAPAKSGEWTVRHKDGAVRHVYSTMFPLLRAGKCEAVCCMEVDITARREAEQALAAEKERLNVTLRSIADGVITTDTAGRVVLMNKVAELLTGWTQADAAGKLLSAVFKLLNARTHQPTEDPVTEILQAEGTLEISSRTAILPHPLSEWIIAYSSAPIRNAAGELVGAVVVFRDISVEQKMAEERLRASKLESIGILAGGIAHDFNNILTVIIGNLSVMKLALAPTDKNLPQLEEAEKASLRAKNLTRQLLTFAKGGAPIRQPASIAELIRESTGFALSGSNVRCDFSFAPELWTVEVDPGQISQVIDNLVINAVQAMPKGGALRVRAENVELGDPAGVDLPAGKYIRILVEDEGEGIPREQLPKIFDPYFTTKPTGTGLGLATAYSIVARHNGSITVQSAVGVGTTFEIHLPASVKQLSPLPESKSGLTGGEGRVLIMDDDDFIRELASSMLRHLGYHPETARDGEEAIRRYTEARASGQPFDALIIDLTIPGGMGGQEAIQHLRQIDPGFKAIVSSGYSNDPVMANHREYGFAGVMAKPYRIQDLANVLQEVLSGDGRPPAA